ncbi:MAG: hypothetical protein J6K51_03470 [Clostridia bacterium]|nr:hypothetical protein [Clostridia bacterium]
MSQFPYNDILNLPYPNEEIERDFPDKVLHAAQFAPFAALTGHEEQVEETARVTEEEILLDDTAKEILNRKFCYLREHLSENPEISVTYFIKDQKKEGGSYAVKTGNLAKILTYEQAIVFSDGEMLFMKQIHSVNSPLFCEIGQEIPSLQSR